MTVGWDNFFVACAGASAALTGLLFVAVSINLNRILEFPQLPGRAGETLVVLLTVLSFSILGLAPGLSRGELGLCWAVTWAIACGFISWVQITGARSKAQHHWMLRLTASQLPLLFLLLAGISLLIGAPGGVRFLLPATLLSFAGASVNAWVLLVEIQR